jgi:hypothetical protein
MFPVKRVLLGAAAVAALAIPPAAVAEAPAGTALAVGGPADPVVLKAGKTVTTSIRVTNGSAVSEQVALSLATLTPEDDGRLNVVDRADPAWAGRVDMPARLTVRADSAVEVPVKVTAPVGLPGDYYLIGVLAEPIDNKPVNGVRVNARVAAVLNMDVPGRRERKFATSLGGLPSLRFSSTLHGTVDVRNVGDAGAMARTQVRIDDRDGRNLAVLPVSGDGLQLLPAGTKRTLSYTWTTTDWFTVVRPSSDVAFLNDGRIVGDVTARSETVVLVSARLVIAIGLAILFAGVAIGGLVRRRRNPAPIGKHARGKRGEA